MYNNIEFKKININDFLMLYDAYSGTIINSTKNEYRKINKYSALKINADDK